MGDLILFVGFRGSGKDTAAELLIDAGYEPFSFANSLKDALAAIFCWPRSLLEGKTLQSRVWRETVDRWWAERLGIPHFTPRYAMSTIGTDVMRAYFHDDLWVLSVERQLDLLPNHMKRVVILDGRFPNEIAFVRRKGGQFIRIKRGPEPEWYDIALRANAGDAGAVTQMAALGVHPSEWAWIGMSFDAVIENDGAIEDLHRKLRQLVGRPEIDPAEDW